MLHCPDATKALLVTTPPIMMAGVAILLLITLLLQSPVISFNYFTILISFIFLRNGLGCVNVLIMQNCRTSPTLHCTASLPC